MVAEWPFRESGAERIYTALVKLDFSNLKCVLKSCIGQNEEIYTISLFISILTVPHRAKLPAANHGHRIKKLV